MEKQSFSNGVNIEPIDTTLSPSTTAIIEQIENTTKEFCEYSNKILCIPEKYFEKK